VDADALKTDNYPRQDLNWGDIEDLIKRWGKRYPKKMRENIQWVVQARAEAKDPKYGEWSEGNRKLGTRLSIIIHPELLNYIETMYPQFLKENSHVATFKKRFKAFVVPTKI